MKNFGNLLFVFTLVLCLDASGQQYLNETEENKEAMFLDFVGNGNLQSSISQGDDIQASTGLGVIFERFFNGNSSLFESFELEASINVASTVDAIEAETNDSNEITNGRDFGTYILNPLNSKQSFFLNTIVYFTPSKYSDDHNGIFNEIANYISGINIRIGSSNSIWKFDDNEVNLGVLAIRGNIFHEFIPNDRLRVNGKTQYSIKFGLGLGYRGIFGDIRSESNKDNRLLFLGSDRTNFSGLNFNFGIRLNNIRAEFDIPILRGSNEISIDGLTDTQFLFTIRFVGGFGLKLNTQQEGS